MTKITLLSALTALLIIPSVATAATTAELDPGPGETANAGTWTRVLTVTTFADVGVASKLAQTVVINVIPPGNFSTMQYRVLKTNANGSWINGDAQQLLFGQNTITIPAVTDANFLRNPNSGRSVKIQFRSDDIAFNSLTINGNDAMPGTTPPTSAQGTQGIGVPISQYSDVFAVTSSATWVRAATMTTPADGASSEDAQTAVINVTYIPEGGAMWRTNKTVANGSWYAGNEQTLVLGENTVTVGAVLFDRTVKVQFSSAAIEIDALTFNGVNQLVADPAEGTQGIGEPFSDFPSIFDDSNSTWPAVATLTENADGVASHGEQTLVVNITYIPEGGATFRSNRTVANGNWDPSSTVTLVIGENTLTVGSVDYDRIVRAQFSSAAVEFDALTINGVDMLAAEGTQGIGEPISQYANIFAPTNSTVLAQGWLRVATLTTAADGAASQGEQSVVINVTYIPSGGVNYRINRTVANGNYNSDDAVALVLGENTITVSSVDYDRAVKLQFSSDAVEFDALTINGEDMLSIDNSGDKVTIANSNLFSTGSNATWVAVLTTAVSQDGASSQNDQTVIMNVTSLPSGGANYRIYRTTENGGSFFSNATALSLGENTIYAPSVAFDRSVKIQFSSDAVEYNALSINGVARVIGASVTEAPSVTINGTTLTWSETDGTTLQFSDDLESWTSLPSATSPYSPSTTPDRFYRTISEE